MNKLKKNKLALIGVICEIKKIFSLGEVNDTQINKLKMHIKDYEYLKKEENEGEDIHGTHIKTS